MNNLKAAYFVITSPLSLSNFPFLFDFFIRWTTLGIWSQSAKFEKHENIGGVGMTYSDPQYL